ncbi:lysophospholipid acyltransferase family protein [Coraliomargarita sinensis]|uniref:lysophospholipid acyltransferase family protein n=1 Tax=Coraliomargarita sinensis TaxID=2174842 RepID=UPI001304AC5B|nr:lysophospholipid acyltransferase family protein [Coraliomargarita sinensis]
MSSSRLSNCIAYAIRVLCGCIVRSFPEHHFNRPVVFYSNHTSNLDFPVIWAALPKKIRANLRPLAAEDYWSKGKLRRFLSLKIFQAILIARKAVNRENNPIQKMEQALSEGSSLIIFPEGTRSLSGEIGEFKPGIHHLASSDRQLAFVPVYLENLFRILPKGERFPLPLVAMLYIGDPIYLGPEETKEDFLQRTRKALIDLNPNPTQRAHADSN